MLRRFTVASFIALVVLSTALIFVPEGSAQQARPSSLRERTDAAVALRNDMRKLWEDHITWTRCVIISSAHDLPDLALTTQRLLDNQDDLGDAVKPYYGNAAGAELAALLRQHILGAAAILDAAKNNPDELDAAITVWYANANDIASFLHAANPEQWPLAVLQGELREHLDLTLQEATARLGGNFATDIAKYDAVHLQILGLAD